MSVAERERRMCSSGIAGPVRMALTIADVFERVKSRLSAAF
jgi:hypothetical protein